MYIYVHISMNRLTVYQYQSNRQNTRQEKKLKFRRFLKNDAHKLNVGELVYEGWFRGRVTEAGRG